MKRGNFGSIVLVVAAILVLAVAFGSFLTPQTDALVTGSQPVSNFPNDIQIVSVEVFSVAVYIDVIANEPIDLSDMIVLSDDQELTFGSCGKTTFGANRDVIDALPTRLCFQPLEPLEEGDILSVQVVPTRGKIAVLETILPTFDAQSVIVG